MISLILSRGHVTHIQHVSQHLMTRLPHRSQRRKNGSLNLSLGSVSRRYSNCSCDSWQEPRGIAKEPSHCASPSPSNHHLPGVTQRRLPASVLVVINFPTPTLDMVHMRVIPSISLCADPLILPVCLLARLSGAFEFKRSTCSGSWKILQGH